MAKINKSANIKSNTGGGRRNPVEDGGGGGGTTGGGGRGTGANRPGASGRAPSRGVGQKAKMRETTQLKKNLEQQQYGRGGSRAGSASAGKPQVKLRVDLNTTRSQRFPGGTRRATGRGN